MKTPSPIWRYIIVALLILRIIWGFVGFKACPVYRRHIRGVIASSYVHRKNLVQEMITGRKKIR